MNIKSNKENEKIFRRKIAVKTEKARICNLNFACIFGLNLYLKIRTFVKKYRLIFGKVLCLNKRATYNLFIFVNAIVQGKFC